MLLPVLLMAALLLCWGAVWFAPQVAAGFVENFILWFAIYVIGKGGG